MDMQLIDKCQEALTSVEATFTTLLQKHGKLHPTSIFAARQHGLMLQWNKQYTSALGVLKNVRSLQAQVHGEEHPDTLVTAWRIGSLLILPDTGITDLAAAVKLLRWTASKQSHCLSPEHPNTLRTLVSLGEAIALQDLPDGRTEAKKIFERCEKLQKRILDAAHPELVKTQALLVQQSRCPRV